MTHYVVRWTLFADRFPSRRTFADVKDAVAFMTHLSTLTEALPGMRFAMDSYYSCGICEHVNHGVRPQCQQCGTIPAKYSFTRRESRYQEREDFTACIPVSRARGCWISERTKAAKVYFRTVPADYYAS